MKMEGFIFCDDSYIYIHNGQLWTVAGCDEISTSFFMEAATFLWEEHSRYGNVPGFDKSREPKKIKPENTIAEYRSQG